MEGWLRGIVRQIKKNDPTQTELFLSQCQINETLMASISSALHRNTFITEIDLSRNHIGLVGAAAIANLLSQFGSPIRKLNLAHNVGICDAGAQVISSSLQKNNSLVHMDLEGCCISEVGEAFLATALLHNHSLHYLFLDDNKKRRNIVRENQSSKDVIDRFLETNRLGLVPVLSLAKKTGVFPFSSLHNSFTTTKSDIPTSFHPQLAYRISRVGNLSALYTFIRGVAAVFDGVRTDDARNLTVEQERAKAQFRRSLKKHEKSKHCRRDALFDDGLVVVRSKAKKRNKSTKKKF